jgi:ERCC4-type nuclease
MIIEDACEQERSASGRTYIGDVFFKRNVPYKRAQLTFGGIQCGDYTNEDYDFLVERKKAPDFVASVLDGRLFDQIAKMHDYYEGYREVIFIGDWDETIESVRKEHGEGVAAFVESSQLRLQLMGVQWFVACDEHDAAKRIIFLDKYAKGNKKFQIKQAKRKWHISDERMKLLLTFPNIGSQGKGKILLEKYKTLDTFIQYAIHYPKECEKDLKGTRIGRDTIDKLVELFTSEKEVIFHETERNSGKDEQSGDHLLQQQSTSSGHRHFYRRRQNN